MTAMPEFGISPPVKFYFNPGQVLLTNQVQAGFACLLVKTLLLRGKKENACWNLNINDLRMVTLFLSFLKLINQDRWTQQEVLTWISAGYTQNIRAALELFCSDLVLNAAFTNTIKAWFLLLFNGTPVSACNVLTRLQQFSAEVYVIFTSDKMH